MSSLPLALSLLSLLAACDVGNVRDARRTDGGDLGGDDDDDVDSGPGTPGPDAGEAAACREPVNDVGGGEHNAGQACIACHAADDGPDFTLAGTLYGDAAGTTPLAGATIIAVDADGATVEMVTRQNGNFWTSEPLAFPVHVVATSCPDVAPMAGAVAAPGDCNAGGCHAAGAPSGRVHLP